MGEVGEEPGGGGRNRPGGVPVGVGTGLDHESRASVFRPPVQGSASGTLLSLHAALQAG